MIRALHPRKLIQRMNSAYTQKIDVTRFKAANICLVGSFAFPLYYVIWHYIFQQPYENLGLRTVGSIMCISFWFLSRYDGKWKTLVNRFIPIYFYGLVVYSEVYSRAVWLPAKFGPVWQSW